MPGPVRPETPANASAEQCQVSHGIQQLVSGELIGHPQPTRIQDPVPINHHSVLQTAASSQPSSPELLDFLGEREGSGST